ncbi:MAG: hypothetical protein JXB48_16725 [Candidatus Latescibacteria bacterium]|nr:hypothetical protein [Candidatus Latescibacterota bacterium]
MTPRERLLTVLHGETPDVVPWFADLSNWFNAERKQRFIPSQDKELDIDMIEICKEAGTGIYIELGGIIDTVYDGDVEEKQRIEGDTFLWTLKTPAGQIQEVRTYNEQSCSWDIARRMVQNIKDVNVVRYAMERRQFIPRFDKYRKMVEVCGEYGLPYACGVPYSGLGFFISRFMGVENTIYALHDYSEEMGKTIELINRVNLDAIEFLCDSPAEVILISDNLSSDVQSPTLFQKYSAEYYTKAAEKIHRAGKFFAVHLDGRVRGLLTKLVQCGVDIADALTPKPTGDLTPKAIRAEGGNNIILSGGVSPVFWSPNTSEKDFIAHVKEWLNLKTISPRLIMSDGDQTPPGTSFQRIKLMKDIVEEYGRY